MELKDIEAELSYAYLHAVAAHAGVACQATQRSHDNLGIDAMLSVCKDFGEDARLTDITLHVQLKATVKPPARKGGRLSYFLEDLTFYDRLRAGTERPPKILSVLFLPQEPARWLTHSPEQLALHRCAYWVCLTGAPASANATGQTIYFPETQQLSPTGLLDLFGRLARLERLCYAR